MQSSFEYDRAYDPAIPVAGVEIRRANNIPGLHLNVIIDSGADATIIPVHFLEQIKARKAGRSWMRGVAQNRVMVERYLIWLQIDGHRRMNLKVVGDTVGEEAILGRDVLNHLIVTLNGLASTVEISD